MQAISLHRPWTSRQALLLVTLCLAVGITSGWLIRALQGTSSSNIAPPRAASLNTASTTSPADPPAPTPSPARLKEMADAQAAPLLAKLAANHNNADTLAEIANLYYDAQQYPVAVDYYNRALQSRPTDASVRTDMATAYWYIGNTEEALSQFNKALSYAPTNPNTLFNMGLVKWQAQHDSAGAIALWKKLLDSNPNYEQKDKVLQMLSDVEKQTSPKASTKG